EKGATLELTHGGPAVLPLLHAVAGGRLHDGEQITKVVAPELAELRAGVDIGSSQHLLTAFSSEGRSVVVDSARLAALAGELGWLTDDAAHDERDQRRGRAARVHPFAVAGGTRRLIDRLDPERLATVAWTSPQELAKALPEGLAHLLDVGELTAGALAARLGGPDRACHLLRLTQSDELGSLVGGYSVILRAD
ncbi:MAG TPA: hypothetical protein VHM65_06790, partial [Candidatus Lustribacter sp.]|nr:hypothetical protein [Candidatus Lustribacter sp.]